MPDVRVLNPSGKETVVPAAAIEALQSGLRGPLLTPESPGYDEARVIWNAMIDKRPALIACCRGTADVMRCVEFAAMRQLLVSVRGGGHNIAGNAVCDGGFMIHLGDMRSVHVDPKSRRAWVEPGVTLADLDHETQAYGLAVPAGINSTTGIAGLTLGGGFGWLTRKHGMTVDSLISADVVTAEGQRVHASADENADLFWAIRGGGGNFGVITCFEFQLHPVGPTVLAGLIVFPFSDARNVLTRFREFVKTAPDELTVWSVLRKAPPLPFLPAEVHGKEIVVCPFCYCGDPAQGEQWIAPIRGFGKPLGEHVGPQPFAAWQRTFDPLLTPGARNYWKSHNFSALSDGALDAVIKYAGRLPSPHCEMFIGHCGGQAARVASDATAYVHRDVQFILNVHARWETAAEDQKCVGWAREFFNAATPFATGGVYVNFITQEEQDRITAAYGPAIWKRLVETKQKWDPQNLFRMNQNIKPTA